MPLAPSKPSAGTNTTKVSGNLNPKARSGWNDGSIFNWALLILLVALGVFLRLDNLSQQLLLDDEWHSLSVASKNSFGWLFAHFNNQATCIPINLYQRAALYLVGWSEFWIRLPNLLCGLAVLAAFPLLLRRIVGWNAALWFSFFISASPFLVYYTRNSRPYAIFLLLSFLAVLFAYRWFCDGGKLDLTLFVLCSGVAAYFHLFALPTAAACWGGGGLAKLLRGRGQARWLPEINPSWRELAVAAAGIALMVLCLYALPVRNGMFAELAGETLGQRVPLSDYPWRGCYEYLCGSAQVPWLILLGALALTGLARLATSDDVLLPLLLLGAAGANLAAAVVSSPASVDVPLILARYCIVAFPIFFLLCAVGVEWLRVRMFDRLRRARLGFLGTIIVIVAGAGYLWATPHRNMLRWKPNNFAMHSAFIESYRELDWKRPYRSQFFQEFGVTTNDIPEFYRQVVEDNSVQALVEYPMPIEDHFNIHYFYQHHHRKRVYVAYRLGEDAYDTLSDSGYRSLPIGGYLPVAAVRPDALKFANLVDLQKPDALARTGATHFVVHKNYFAEIRGRQAGAVEPHAQQVAAYLRSVLGPPRYEDSRLWVFEIKFPMR